jgi:hypothetical protein
MRRAAATALGISRSWYLRGHPPPQLRDGRRFEVEIGWSTARAAAARSGGEAFDRPVWGTEKARTG